MRNIESENPEDHWKELNVAGKLVLDLGCGLFGQPLLWNTPGYFIRRGASKVIGVDPDMGSFQQIIETLPPWKIEVVPMAISNGDELIELFHKYKPDVVKCDIEGAEKYFDDFAKSDLNSNLTELAIEYHDNNTKKIIDYTFSLFDFKIQYIQLLGHDIERIGVMYATKY